MEGGLYWFQVGVCHNVPQIILFSSDFSSFLSHYWFCHLLRFVIFISFALKFSNSCDVAFYWKGFQTEVTIKKKKERAKKTRQLYHLTNDPRLPSSIIGAMILTCLRKPTNPCLWTKTYACSWASSLVFFKQSTSFPAQKHPILLL